MEKWKAVLVVALLLGIAMVSWAATTYTAPTSYGERSDRVSHRYATPVQGLMVVEATTTTQSDQTVAIDTNLSGYLDRVTITHDGNDAAWSLSITDTDAVTLFTKADLNAADDPCSFIVSFPSADGTYYGGVPFVGGLTLTIADANTTGVAATAIHVKLYVREQWRR